jgi:3-deoxy-7-phosphoheptulonate synthase
VRDAALDSVELYASHEALILEYERALTRIEDGKAYDLSGHFIWVGDRTRQMDGAHLDFVSRLANPIGVKLGPSATPEFAAEVVERLDPTACRAGSRDHPNGNARVRDVLPPIIEKVASTGHLVVWHCDPMHGNTEETRDGIKTRHLDRVIDEWTGSSTRTPSSARIPAAVIELTGDDVTECTEARNELTTADLARRYETARDPG